MYEYKKLRGRIVEKFDSQVKFAEFIGLSDVSVSKKMNCASGFSQEDIEKWAAALDIPRDEFGIYFFT